MPHALCIVVQSPHTLRGVPTAGTVGARWAHIYGYLGDTTEANLLTVTNLALHEGSRRQACADGVAEAALGVQALAGTALTQCSGAQVHVLCWWL